MSSSKQQTRNIYNSSIIEKIKRIEESIKETTNNLKIVETRLNSSPQNYEQISLIEIRTLFRQSIKCRQKHLKQLRDELTIC